MDWRVKILSHWTFGPRTLLRAVWKLKPFGFTLQELLLGNFLENEIYSLSLSLIWGFKELNYFEHAIVLHLAFHHTSLQQDMETSPESRQIDLNEVPAYIFGCSDCDGMNKVKFMKTSMNWIQNLCITSWAWTILMRWDVVTIKIHLFQFNIIEWWLDCPCICISINL